MAWNGTDPPGVATAVILVHVAVDERRLTFELDVLRPP
jgi:hypothetical protein